MGVLDHVNLIFVDDTAKAAAFMSWLDRSRPVLGVDTETGGFNPWQDPLRLIQFGDLDTGWAIPWDRFSGVAIEALNKYDRRIVLHNSPFDSKFITHHAGSYLHRWKWEWTNDTMTMAHLLDPLRPKGLKPLAALHVDSKAVSAQRMLDEGMSRNKWTWGTVPLDFPPYWIYAAMDPVLTAHMDQKFMPQIEASYQAVYDLEIGVLRVVTNMMNKGALVDLEYAEAKQRELMTWVASARSWLAETFGIANATSNPQVLKALAENNVQLLDKRTDSGNQSLDKEVLELCDHPIALYVQKIRQAEKNVGPYFRNFLKMADSNNRVHPTIWAMGTRTGRMSITEPALQTLPRKDPTVRDAFIPSPGNSLLAIDADQIEARLAAHFSQDQGMADAFASEEDFFVGLARQIFQDPSLDKKDPRRQLTKGVVYGKLYGAGVEKMALTAKVPFDVMASVESGFTRAFPGIRVLQDKINSTAKSRAQHEGRAYILTPWGRRLVADDNKEYTMTNYLIQSHAAEVLKINLLHLDAAGLGEYMTLPVHDEILFDVPTDIVEEVQRTAEGIMNDPSGYFVPITWSGDIMHERWGEKYR